MSDTKLLLQIQTRATGDLDIGFGRGPAQLLPADNDLSPVDVHGAGIMCRARDDLHEVHG